MWQVLTCLPSQHDMRYIALAVLICVLGSLLSMRLLARVRRNSGTRRLNLLFLSGLVAGGTVWTTHFAAMLGYNAPIARAFEPSLTCASLVITVVFAWIGFYITTRTRLGPAIEAGGAIFGIGIAAMHYTGMAAFETPGVLGWNYPLISRLSGAMRSSFMSS